MDKESFRKYGYKFVDWVVDYFESIEKHPVKSPLEPGDIRKRLPENLEKPSPRGSPWRRFSMTLRRLYCRA